MAAKEAAYRCPGCGCCLTLREGQIRVKHFAHKAAATCTPETVAHATAKKLIARIIQKWLDGKSKRFPVILIPCPGIQAVHRPDLFRSCGALVPLPLDSLEIDEVRLETKTLDGLRPDVLLLGKGSPALAIEVLVTHAVNTEKSARTSIPWVELEAAKVMKSPYKWAPRQMSLRADQRCERCGSVDETELRACHHRHEFQELVAKWSFVHQLRAWLRDSGSISGPSIHWRCPRCNLHNSTKFKPNRCYSVLPKIKCGGYPKHRVLMENHGRPVLEIGFLSREKTRYPWFIWDIPPGGAPALIVLADSKRPSHLILNGTNIRDRFICKHCLHDAGKGARSFDGWHGRPQDELICEA